MDILSPTVAHSWQLFIETVSHITWSESSKKIHWWHLFIVTDFHITWCGNSFLGIPEFNTGFISLPALRVRLGLKHTVHNTWCGNSRYWNIRVSPRIKQLPKPFCELFIILFKALRSATQENVEEWFPTSYCTNTSHHENRHVTSWCPRHITHHVAGLLVLTVDLR